MRQRITRSKKREGAVLVEGVMAVSMLVIMLGCVTFIHRLALADVKAAQEARFMAWHEAMTGCQDQDFELRTLVSDLAAGRLPLPDSFIPSGTAEGKGAGSAAGVLSFASRKVTHVARIPCRALPASPPPAPGAWLLDMFL